MGRPIKGGGYLVRPPLNPIPSREGGCLRPSHQGRGNCRALPPAAYSSNIGAEQVLNNALIAGINVGCYGAIPLPIAGKMSFGNRYTFANTGNRNLTQGIL